MPLVVYGIGSPIIVEVDETCRRLNLPVSAWVANIEGPQFAPLGATVVGADDLPPDTLVHPFLVALFTPGHRHAAFEDAKRRGFTQAATLLDPTAVIAASATIAPGSYVNSMANIGGATRIGAAAFVNRGASIGHHVECSDFVSIGPAAVVGGLARIERGAVVAAGAVVLPEMQVGANAVVGAGAVVTRPVAPHTLVAGNPARVIRRDIPGYGGLSV